MDHALALPWDRYENYDMVVWGVRERVEEGEMEGAQSIKCGERSLETPTTMHSRTASALAEPYLTVKK